jgi:hypothetical protein
MLFVMVMIGVGYVECVIGYVVFIQAYAVTSDFVASRISSVNVNSKFAENINQGQQNIKQ